MVGFDHERDGLVRRSVGVSRLTRSAPSPSGRPVAVEITTPLAGLEVGYRYRVLGDEIGVDGGIRFAGKPTAATRGGTGSRRFGVRKGSGAGRRP